MREPTRLPRLNSKDLEMEYKALGIRQNTHKQMESTFHDPKDSPRSRPLITEVQPLRRELPPTYQQHKTSARCAEDLWNPAPSYAYIMQLRGPDGADMLAEWVGLLARRIFGKSRHREFRSESL
jgi:hypothetical protein